MFIELSSMTFEEKRIDGVFDDEDMLINLLGATPIGEFRYKIACSLLELGLKVCASVEGRVSARCDLCGGSAEANCEAFVEDVFTRDDTEYDPIKNGFSLEKFLEDCIVLSMPRTVRCKPDCKGLCLKCGTNLNFKTCSCESATVGENNPFGVLQDIINNDGGAKNGSTKK